MYLLVSKFCFLVFRLLLSRVAPYLQFVTTNCLISWNIGFSKSLLILEQIKPKAKNIFREINAVFKILKLQKS